MDEDAAEAIRIINLAFENADEPIEAEATEITAVNPVIEDSSLAVIVGPLTFDQQTEYGFVVMVQEGATQHYTVFTNGGAKRYATTGYAPDA